MQRTIQCSSPPTNKKNNCTTLWCVYMCTYCICVCTCFDYYSIVWAFKNALEEASISWMRWRIFTHTLLNTTHVYSIPQTPSPPLPHPIPPLSFSPSSSPSPSLLLLSEGLQTLQHNRWQFLIVVIHDVECTIYCTFRMEKSRGKKDKARLTESLSIHIHAYISFFLLPGICYDTRASKLVLWWRQGRK